MWGGERRDERGTKRCHIYTRAGCLFYLNTVEYIGCSDIFGGIRQGKGI